MFMHTSAIDLDETERQPVRLRCSTLGQCSAMARSELADSWAHPLDFLKVCDDRCKKRSGP
jgi:hypothetical protein